MIKYADIRGYDNCGELSMFTHFYQLIQKDVEIPMIIILHAYEGETKAFKGYLLTRKKTFENVPLLSEERKAFEPYVGEITQVDLDVLLSGSVFEGEITGYQKVGTTPSGFNRAGCGRNGPERG